MSTTSSRLRAELKQSKPFPSAAAEAAVAILRTADRLRQHYAAAIEPHGVTAQQYNVLRILRGSHPDPLPTLEIGQRLIEHDPGITRLLDRLVEKGLVSRARCPVDRRRVQCRITDRGLELLTTMEPVIARADREAIGSLDEAGAARLTALLDRVREGAE